MSPSYKQLVLLFAASLVAKGTCDAWVNCYSDDSCSNSCLTVTSTYQKGADSQCVDVTQCVSVDLHLDPDFDGAEAYCEDNCPVFGGTRYTFASYSAAFGSVSGCFKNDGVKSVQLFTLSEGRGVDGHELKCTSTSC